MSDPAGTDLEKIKETREIIQVIRQDPVTYLGPDYDLDKLFIFLIGLSERQKVVNTDPDEDWYLQFKRWIEMKYSEYGGRNYAGILELRADNKAEAWKLFFKHLDEFDLLYATGEALKQLREGCRAWTYDKEVETIIQLKQPEAVSRYKPLCEVDTVKELISIIKIRPAMYFGSYSIAAFQFFISGWVHGNHSAIEDLAEWRQLQELICKKYGQEKTEDTYAQALLRQAGGEKEALELLFQLSEEFYFADEKE